MKKPRPLLEPADCPHLSLDARDPARLRCRQCGTPWALVQAATAGVGPTLFGTKAADTRLAMHAAGENCDACGTTNYPHN